MNLTKFSRPCSHFGTIFQQEDWKRGNAGLSKVSHYITLHHIVSVNPYIYIRPLFWPHFSVLFPVSVFYPPFQRFIPILAFYPQFNVLSSFRLYRYVKLVFHWANLFARTDKKVGTLPTCSRRIFSPANFNQSRCRILVFASRVILSCYGHEIKQPIKFLVLIRTMDLIGPLIW